MCCAAIENLKALVLSRLNTIQACSNRFARNAILDRDAFEMTTQHRFALSMSLVV